MINNNLISHETSKKLFKSLLLKNLITRFWFRDDGLLVTDNDISPRFSYTPAYTVGDLFDIIFSIKIDLWFYHNDGKYLIQSKTHPVSVENESLPEGLAEIILFLREHKWL